MTTTDRRPLVRPGFLKWSSIVFALLAVVLAHNVWGYVETRRLSSAIATLERNGEPVAEPFRRPTGRAADADRSFRAAAVLAEGLELELSSNQLSHRLLQAERTGDWPAELVGLMRSVTERHREAIVLAERASQLPFEGFKGSPITGGFNAGIVSLVRLVGLDATLRALDGDSAAAVDLLTTEAQLGLDADRMVFSPLFSQNRLAADVRVVVERVRPPAAGLARLAAVLETLDQDDRPKRELQQARLAILRNWQRARGSSGLFGPLWLHQTIGQIETMSRFVSAAAAPWPERIDRITAAGDWPITWASRDRRNAILHGLVVRGGQDTAIVRATRIVVAVERYRRDHGENAPALQDLVPGYLPSAPIDPFSGKAMVFETDAQGYVAYSVGPDRRDDGGRDVIDRFASATAWPRGTTTADTGIRIRYR